MISHICNKMTVKLVKDPVKYQEYVAKLRKNVRNEMRVEASKKGEAEARKLRSLQEKERKAHEAKTLPSLDSMEALKSYTALRPMDINNLINLLPPPPTPNQKKKRGPKPKQSEDINDNRSFIHFNTHPKQRI